MINYDEEIRNFRSSMDISAVEDQIVQSDLTDMKDILMEILKSEVRENSGDRGNPAVRENSEVREKKDERG